MFPLLCGSLRADFLPVFSLQASNALHPLHGSIHTHRRRHRSHHVPKSSEAERQVVFLTPRWYRQGRVGPPGGGTPESRVRSWATTEGRRSMIARELHTLHNN